MDLTQYITENIERLPWEVRNQAGDVVGSGWVDVDVAAITQGFLLAVTSTTVEPGETAEEKQRIGARKASTSESNILGIEKGSALLTMDRTAYDNSGRAVEYGHHCYRPDLYSFEVTLVEK